MRKRFKFLGESGIYHFLWTVKHPVPEWHDWAKSRGMLPETRKRMGGEFAGRKKRA